MMLGRSAPFARAECTQLDAWPDTIFFGYRDPNPPAGRASMGIAVSPDERESVGGIVVDYGPGPNASPAP